MCSVRSCPVLRPAPPVFKKIKIKIKQKVPDPENYIDFCYFGLCLFPPPLPLTDQQLQTSDTVKRLR